MVESARALCWETFTAGLDGVGAAWKRTRRRMHLLPRCDTLLAGECMYACRVLCNASRGACVQHGQAGVRATLVTLLAKRKLHVHVLVREGWKAVAVKWSISIRGPAAAEAGRSFM
jgi:hypothetical protein